MRDRRGSDVRLGQRPGMSPEQQVGGSTVQACVMTEQKPRRRIFWPLVVSATIAEAVAAASLATAVFSDPVPRRISDYSGSQTEIFDRVTSLSWSTDRGLLVVAITFFALGVLTLLVAARSR